MSPAAVRIWTVVTEKCRKMDASPGEEQIAAEVAAALIDNDLREFPSRQAGSGRKALHLRQLR